MSKGVKERTGRVMKSGRPKSRVRLVLSTMPSAVKSLQQYRCLGVYSFTVDEEAAEAMSTADHVEVVCVLPHQDASLFLFSPHIARCEDKDAIRLVLEQHRRAKKS